MSEFKPYYQSEGVTVYHARWEDVVAAGLVPVKSVKLIHDDPPYGNNAASIRDGATARGGAGGHGRGWPLMAGDDRPFDPAPILALSRPTVLWGANHYASRLPDSRAYIFWDKREDSTPDTSADGELAWTNLGGTLRTFRHVWRGCARASETGELHLHPTQKPVALSIYVYQPAGLRAGDLLFVPHGGSGPDLPAARAMGLCLIWCDVEQWCCDVAIARLPDAPPMILERAKAFQQSTREATRPDQIGPLFDRTITTAPPPPTGQP